MPWVHRLYYNDYDMNAKWKIIASTGLMTAVSALYIWAVPAIINLPAHREEIEHKILENSGYNISLGNTKLSMGTFPSIWIKSDNIALLNNDNSKAISIDNPRIKIKLLPLLFKKIEISHVYADKEIVNFVFTKNKEFMLGDNPIKPKKRDNHFEISKVNVDIGDYTISIDDRFNNKKLSLRGEYLKNAKFISNHKVQLSTKGEFVTDNKSMPYFMDVEFDLPLNNFNEDKLRINGNIKDFDLSAITYYAPVFTNGVIQKTNGILNFEADTRTTKYGHRLINASLWTNGLEIIGADKPSQIIYHDKLTLNTNFETITNGLNFKNSSLESKDFKFTVDGKLAASGKKIPQMDLRINIEPAKLQDIVKILPWFRAIPPDMDFYKFKETDIYGNGEGKLHLIGNGGSPQTFGNIKLRNLHVINTKLIAPEGGSVDMDFQGSIMKLNVFVPISKIKNVTINGFAKIDGSKYSELNIKNEGDIDIALAKTVLMPLHDMLKFKLGPLPVMNVNGTGSINVRSAGKKVDPHIWGNIKFKNGRASFTQVNNMVLNNAAGEVIFNDRDITFKTTSGTINGKRAYIEGECDVFGGVNVQAQTKGQKIPDMIKVINTSADLSEVQKVVAPFTRPDGIADLFLTIYGKVKDDVTQIQFNEDLFAKGKVVFHNATTVLQDTYLPFRNINGEVNFDKQNADYNVTGYLRNSKVYVTGTAQDEKIDLTASSDRFKLIDLWDATSPDLFVPFKHDLGNLEASVIAKYKGKADTSEIDYDKIIADGKLLSNMQSSNPIRLKGANYSLKNSILNVSGIKGIFKGSPFTLSFIGADIYNILKIKDAVFDFENFDISNIEDIKNEIQIPDIYKKEFENLSDFRGNININGNIKNGAVYSNTNLKNISFRYLPLDIPIEILSGNANMRGNTLYLSKVNSKFSSMPVFLNGNISDILNKPNLNLYVSGKLNQDFFDKLVNQKSVYPVKLKGDANFNTRLSGELTGIHADTELNVKENSSIYYMGATLSGAPSGLTDYDGIATNPISIKSNIVINPGKIKINSLDYIQTITSQNKKISQQKQLSMSGIISLLNNNILKFQNLKIKTFEPTDAKIFNILLKKPNIKQGTFMTDILINGTSSAPYALGTLNISGIDMPLLDSTIQDIDINMQKDYIDLNSRGVILTNDISVIAKILNKPTPPYVIEDFSIKTDLLDLNLISNRFNDYDTNKLKNKEDVSTQISAPPNQIIIKNGSIVADKILIKKAQATDFNANVTMNNDNILQINNYSFKLANGKINGNITTDLNTMDTKASMNIDNADAEIISENFFDMPGQMYGHVTGSLNASCTGLNSVECLNTLSGEGEFKVIDGKMPKLGSLEYLLKAANLVTGGITGVSVNGIIDLITPLKTGEFSQISGDIKVENGVANDINVYSEGKELNMYMTGSYDLASLIADMEVYGSLSKNFSTILGKIGNASLNRLLNRIPWISINEINPELTSNINKIPNFNKENAVRVFKAEIFGDINGNNYVKSFRWIKH